MFNFLKPKNNLNSSLLFKHQSIRVDTTNLKARVVAVQPAGILGRAWSGATKDFFGNVGTTLGAAASNVILDKSLELLIGSLPLLVRTLGWSASTAVAIFPPGFRFLRAHWGTFSTACSRLFTLGSPAAVIANQTSLPAEIKHIVVLADPQANPQGQASLGSLRKMIENTIQPPRAMDSLPPPPTPTLPPLPPEEPLAEAVAKAADALPGHGWLYYGGWATVLILSFAGFYYGYKWATAESPFISSKLFNVNPDTGQISATEALAKVVAAPLPDVDPTWPEQGGFSSLLTYLLTGVVAPGGFTFYKFLPSFLKNKDEKAVDYSSDTEVELHDKRMDPFPNANPGSVRLPPDLENASPLQKQEFLQSLIRNQREIQLNKPLYGSSPITPEQLAEQLAKIDSQAAMTILTSEEYQSLAKEMPTLAYNALLEIASSPDQAAAAAQIFGPF